METIKQNSNYQPAIGSAHILCVGVGWFPQTPGGLERYVYELTQNLAKVGDRIDLCGVGLPATQPDLPINLINLAAPDSPIWQRMWSMRTNFLKHRASTWDAINLHFALYSTPILDLLPPDVPVTCNFHGPWASESKQEGVGKLAVYLKHRFVEKRVYDRCDRFIVLSQAFGKFLHENYQVPTEKIHVIPGGVDLNHFQANLSRQAARTQLGWSCDRPIVFTSRRLVHRVGLDKLLTAVAAIKPRIPDIWLAIAGRGPLQADLQRQATELGLEDNVKFLGFLPDELLPVAYQAADLSVMPSQAFEGFGLAVVESLACGTPALCTPVGGMPEILTPFAPELITASPDAADIGDRLEKLLTQEIPLPSTAACRDYAVNNFDWQLIAQRVRNILISA